MPEILTEVATFDATITVPEAGDDRTAASVRGAFQALANRTLHLFGLVAGVLAADNLWSGRNIFTDGIGIGDEPIYTMPDGTPAPKQRVVMIDAAALQGAEWQPRVQGAAGAAGTSLSGGWGKVLLPLPSGGLLKRVRVGYEHKAAGDTAKIYVRRTTYAKVPPFPQYPAFKLVDKQTSGAIGQEVWDSDEINDPAFDASVASYTLEIAASGDATQPLPDIAHWIEVTYLDPGPRNY